MCRVNLRCTENLGGQHPVESCRTGVAGFSLVLRSPRCAAGASGGIARGALCCGKLSCPWERFTELVGELVCPPRCTVGLVGGCD